MNWISCTHGGLRLAGLLVLALAATYGDAVAQRRPLPPDPRDVLRPPPTVGEQREGMWYLDVHAGLASPVGDLGRVSSSGVSMGLGVGRWFRPSLAFRIRTDVDLPGSTEIEQGPNAGAESPSWVMWAADIGPSFDLTGGSGSFLLTAEFGLGGMLIDADEFQSRSVSELYGTVSPGFGLGTTLGSQASLLVDARYRFMFGDRNALSRMLGDGEATLGHLQLQAGVRFLLGPR